MSSGTGSANGQPSDQQPPAADPRRERAGGEVRERLGGPKATMNDSTAALEPRPKSSSPDERQRRALEADHRADERVEGDEQRELRARSRAARAVPRRWVTASASRAAAAPVRLAATIAAWSGGAGGMSCISAATNSSSDRARARVVAALEAERRDRVRRQAAPADRARVVRRVEQEVVGQRQQLVGAASGRACAPSPRPTSSPRACRSGRPASPTSSASPVSTNHGSSPRTWSVTR